MKKLFLVLLLIAIIVIPSSIAFAEKPIKPNICDTNCKLCKIIKDLPNIIDCRCAIFGSCAFVAVKIRGVASTTDYKNLINLVKDTVTKADASINKVFVSSSVRAFKALENIKKGQYEKLIKDFELSTNDLPIKLPNEKEIPEHWRRKYNELPKFNSFANLTIFASNNLLANFLPTVVTPSVVNCTTEPFDSAKSSFPCQRAKVNENLATLNLSNDTNNLIIENSALTLTTSSSDNYQFDPANTATENSFTRPQALPYLKTRLK
ncbi:MAG: YhcN/YlaJ family sporulation lipoprotein [Clostridia bacterium]